MIVSALAKLILSLSDVSNSLLIYSDTPDTSYMGVITTLSGYVCKRLTSFPLFFFSILLMAVIISFF